MESRYLLILTENLSVLSIILDEFYSKNIHPEVVFGSKFRDDISYTQVRGDHDTMCGHFCTQTIDCMLLMGRFTDYLILSYLFRFFTTSTE